ncbi:hypothetical protein Btru_013156 [Bulinus truncatus]|nr:hypothetical protein Btru_013156 [Bulinus truncatus]
MSRRLPTSREGSNDNVTLSSLSTYDICHSADVNFISYISRSVGQRSWALYQLVSRDFSWEVLDEAFTMATAVLSDIDLGNIVRIVDIDLGDNVKIVDIDLGDIVRIADIDLGDIVRIVDIDLVDIVRIVDIDLGDIVRIADIDLGDIVRIVDIDLGDIVRIADIDLGDIVRIADIDLDDQRGTLTTFRSAPIRISPNFVLKVVTSISI